MDTLYSDQQKAHATEPKVDLHPRFIVVEDDSTLNLKEVPQTEKIITRSIYGKQTTLFKRDKVGGDKTCWFRADDNSSERGKVCFAKGVSPESMDYTLQVLLNRMDETLIDDYHQNHSTDPAAADDDTQQKVQKFVRKQHLDRMIFSIDTKPDDDAPKKKKKWGKTGEEESPDRRTGRTVFYVTVGQMKHTRIMLKGPAPSTQSEVKFKFA
jgi:hypothetical protein